MMGDFLEGASTGAVAATEDPTPSAALVTSNSILGLKRSLLDEVIKSHDSMPQSNIEIK